MKRILSFFAPLAALGAAQAQGLDAASERNLQIMLGQALGRLSLHSTLRMDLVGTETTGSRVVPFWVVATFDRSTSTPRLDLGAYQDANGDGNWELLRRVGADGTTFYMDDPLRKEFATADYSTGKMAQDREGSILQLARIYTRRHSMFPIHLLEGMRAARKGEGRLDRGSWAPWVAPSSIELTPYNGEIWAMVGSGNPATTWMTYRFVAGEEGHELVNISYSERSGSGQKAREVEWRLTVDSGTAVTASQFQFRVPDGYRARPMPSGL